MSTAPATELGPFSAPGAHTTPWASALAILESAEVFWFSTVRPDGRPHVTPLLAVWSLDAICFTTGRQERKARNLARNPRCALTTGTNSLTGTDVTIEGTAAIVTEPADRERAAADFRRKYGEHLATTWSGLAEAVAAGETPLYRVAPAVGFAFGKLPISSQTSYTWSAAR
ncbi:MAG TPA: pyridoxamine 5'-phosphate oxidase family protein [Mycobacteriales bacterium]|nr:pyridoxamine 5'-phosphate oxidase family protein [Mycobacteriales bacterium]